jgi:tRNA(Glu) U13 pseudouridine synthase TruD
MDGLPRAGLRQQHRALRLRPKDPDLELAQGVLEMTFTRPGGEFATAVLRELVNWPEAAYR